MSALTDTPSPNTHEEWAAALSAWFFRPEYAHSHVMFLVDDAALGEVSGGDPGEARESLLDAVRSKLRLRTRRGLFRSIERSTRLWKVAGGEGPPPCLPLLAIAVLAASRMARASDRAGNNYYLPFIELLNLDIEEHDVIHSYGESIPDLWEMLQWWLDQEHRGELGLSTIVPDPHRTRIGYADSQTLFASSDRDKLTRFLRWLGLCPGEPIHEDELLAYFRLWTSAGGLELTLGAQMMLDEDERPRQLIGILARAAQGWQGVSRDDHGRAEATIVITLRWTFRHAELSLVAERPVGFPVELHLRHGTRGLDLQASNAEEEDVPGWYPIPLSLTGSTLEEGIKLESDGRVLRLAGAPIHVLHKRPELGCWASVDRLRPGEQAWLLVRNSLAGRVEAFLRENARQSDPGSQWKWVSREGVAPLGWRLMRDVIIDGAPTQDGSKLGALFPRFQNRLSLQGGLPLPRGSDVYLTNGEPDLWLPEADDVSRLDVTVDGAQQPITGPTLQLGALGLTEGSHHVRAGPISRRFATQRTLGRITPIVDEPLGHAVLHGPQGVTARTLSATTVEAEGDDVLILGARITAPGCPRDLASVDGHRPIVLPVKSQACILLGASPGQIIWVPRAPAKPMWMDIAELDYRVFEYAPSFQPVWVLTEWLSAPTQRARLRADVRPAPLTDEPTERTRAWAMTILEWHSPQEPAANGLWATYMDAAELVLEA